ncbi:hypothetical protein BTW15_19160 [Pseudomonas syringae pv. tomato]|uniref:Prophage PssSM-01 n=5 Tax=Pseudomonas syringae group TaxID=136849 RepID=A0AAW4DZK5_PSESX|nr:MULTISPECIES: hypothetical protein [Pseudomonas syringae group]AVI87359.1 hypothetical protein XJ28_28450 [Pseudomonas syringae pv. tomato]KPB81923.1 putative prophage PSSB64-01 [Pseudomonas syringae pv. maculicola]KPW22064.1 putative prophage PSSB64-01, Orf5 [Pseudomonas cannabina pv. alisalensis]MBH0138407.1 hypothetical protein [Pseudomonas syringae pv. tomato]MBI6701016.1 hypothetical protein [Pseudomonas syringae]
MANAVIVTAQLPQAEAQALLEALREQYRLSLNEYWYDDQYRFVADGQRHGAILAHVPVMAAQKRLMAALSQSLKAVKHS